MSFTVTITNIPDKDLGPLLARLSLPKSASYQALYDPEEISKPQTNGKRKNLAPDTKLMMTGKTAGEGTLLAEGLDLFERLEKKQGIGNVSIQDFRDVVKEKKLDRQISYRMLKEKLLEPVR